MPLSPRERPTFSVVIPCRNEEENIVGIARAVVGEMEKIGEPFELIFIDNASSDRTEELGRTLCAEDDRIKLILNARDFGQMRSPTHAIFQANGKAVINLCADFQDPPELIPQFVERWRNGADIVLGVRESEKNAWTLAVPRAAFYWFMHQFADHPVIPNATGFGIYDRRVVDELRRLREPEPFFRGMLAETGFRLETISYPRPPRAGGISNNDFWRLADFALSGLAGSSKRLLRVPLLVGAASLALCFLSLLGGLLAFLTGRPVATWLIGSAVELQLGLLFIFLGMIGDQLRLVSERTRETPLVVERERVNFAPKD